MKSYNAMQYIDAGCTFAAKTPIPFLGVHGVTDGKVCDTGCAAFAGGMCPAYRKLSVPQAPKSLKTKQGETVREEATRRGLSISEVRRQRNKQQ